MTTSSDEQTTYDESAPGVGGPEDSAKNSHEPLGTVGPWDLDNLSKDDLKLIAKAIKNPKLFEIPPQLLAAAGPALGRILAGNHGVRDKIAAVKTLKELVATNLDTSKYWATLTRENALADQAPVSAPAGNLPPPVDSSPQERRKILIDPAAAMREIHANPELARLADHLNEEASRKKMASD